MSDAGGDARRRDPTLVGVIADTHGHLPAEVHGVFAGVDLILHAGDVVDDATILELETIAPVTAVRGNCDTTGATAALPALANVDVGGARFVVVHRLGDLGGRTDPRAMGARVVVSGHTHRALVARERGLVYVNPGSASDGRGGQRSVALVTVGSDGSVDTRIVRLA